MLGRRIAGEGVSRVRSPSGSGAQTLLWSEASGRVTEIRHSGPHPNLRRSRTGAGRDPQGEASAVLCPAASGPHVLRHCEVGKARPARSDPAASAVPRGDLPGPDLKCCGPHAPPGGTADTDGSTFSVLITLPLAGTSVTGIPRETGTGRRGTIVNSPPCEVNAGHLQLGSPSGTRRPEGTGKKNQGSRWCSAQLRDFP